MSETPTIQLNRVEYDVADFEAALDGFGACDDKEHGYAVSGNVVVFGDGYDDDDDCYVARPDEVTVENLQGDRCGSSRPNESAHHSSVSRLRELIEEATSSFTDYLRDEVFTVGSYTFDGESHNADVRVAENDDGSGYICAEAIASLRDDDGARLVSVKDGWLHVADERDE